MRHGLYHMWKCRAKYEPHYSTVDLGHDTNRFAIGQTPPYDLPMGFNRRKMEDQRRHATEKEVAERRATDAQVLEDAERLIGTWNERQVERMPMLFSPTIGAAITARYWFLWLRCPACRTTSGIDLRTLDRHPDAAVTSLIPLLSCRSCRPHAPFAELIRLSQTSIADEMREEQRRRQVGK